MKKLALLVLCVAVSLQAADKPWPWVGAEGNDAVTMLLLGDINIQKRADPAAALVNVQATLQKRGLRVRKPGRSAGGIDRPGQGHSGQDRMAARRAPGRARP